MGKVVDIKSQPLKPGKKNHQGEGGGMPRKIKDVEQLKKLFFEFIDYVIANDYAMLPSRFQFCKYLNKYHFSIDYSCLLDSINVYYSCFKETLEALQSDVLVEGATYGPYDRTTVIFTLKNWCNWTDKRDLTTAKKEKVTVATPEEAQSNLEQLGYKKA